QGGHAVAQQSRKFDLERIGATAEQRVFLLHHFLHSIIDVGIVVAQQVRGERRVVIDVFLSLRVIDATSLSTNKNDVWVDLPVQGYHPAGNIFFCILTYFRGV